MKSKIINSIIVLILVIFLQIPLITVNKQTEKNNQITLKNLEEISYGEAILSFDKKGTKNLVNVNDIPKEKLSFYLKFGEILTKISDDDLYVDDTPISSGLYDSTGSWYYIKKVSYKLIKDDYEIVVKFIEMPNSLKGLFADSQATKIILKNFKMENVQTMEFMFLQSQSIDASLTQIEISDLNTSKIINMYGLFYGSSYLTQLDVSNWNTSSVTNINSFFFNCNSLTQLNISKWETSNVKDMGNMFNFCSRLTKLDVFDWDTSNVENMESMFSDCQSLNQLDISNWDTSKVKNMNSMFNGCLHITKIDFSGSVSSNVENINLMFSLCNELTELNFISMNFNKITNSYNSDTFLNVKNVKNCTYYRYRDDYPHLFHIYCSDLIGFYYCNDCIEENDTYCKKTITYKKGSSKPTETKKFYYVYEERIINKTERSCYWLKSKQDDDYIKKEDLGIYFKIKCDKSCKTCITISPKCTKCKEGFYPLSNETKEEEMLCFNEITVPKNFYFEIDVWIQCDKSCSRCENTNNCTQCETGYYPLFNETELSSKNCYYELNPPKNYYLDEKVFKKCNESCNSCKTKSTYCTNCSSGFFPLANETSQEYKTCYSILTAPKNFYLDDDMFKQCDNSCSICETTANNCIQCETSYYPLINETELHSKKCYDALNPPKNYYLDEKVFKKCNESCDSCKTKSTLCNNCSNGFFPLANETNEEFKACFSELNHPENYYLDDQVFKVCDKSCDSCKNKSMLCLSCSKGFFPLANNETYKRCFDELSKDKHLYLHNSSEYRECPSECETCIQKPNELTVNCLSCNDKDQEIINGKCTKNEIILIRETLNFTYEELKNNNTLYDILSNYSSTYYANGTYIYQLINKNISLTLYKVDIKNINNSYHNQIKLNIFKVNIENLYEKIAQENNITEDLIYGQVDFLDFSKKVNYLLYDPKFRRIINMNVCEGMDISITKNIELTEEVRNIVNNANEQGYNVVDINDHFYNDVCTPYTTIHGTDITISDRIKNVYDLNFEQFIYYDGCYFDYFNISDSNAIVKCKTKAKTSFFEELKDFKLDTKQLLYNFKFCEVSNFYVVTCYREFLSEEGQKNNYANYIYYVIFAIVLFLFILYRYNGINYLEIKLAKITNKNKFRNANKIESSRNQLNKEITKKIISLKDENLSNPSKKNVLKIKKKSVKSSSNENENKNIGSRVILIQKNKNKKASIKSVGNFSKKGDNNIFINILPIEEKQKNLKTPKKINEIEKILKPKIKNQSIKKNKEKKIKKIKIKDITEVDYKEFDFEMALEYDKRTFMNIYLSYIRIKHPLVYIFYDDYNITAIKFILFAQSFGIHICMNGLFFREDTMHRIYKDNGSFDFIYRLPLTLYSVAISGIITFGLKKLVLTQRRIIEYKRTFEKIKNKDDAIKNAVKTINCYKIKFTFFVFSIILTLIVFWFYIGCFCTVYRNTQYYLLKDSLIGFGLSMFYPFGSFLIIGLLRFVSLKKNCSVLYKISKIFA